MVEVGTEAEIISILGLYFLRGLMAGALKG
jgi:hypothetical protein